MAKQRRVPARPALKRARRQSPRPAASEAPAAAPVPPPPEIRQKPTYVEAVHLYEQGLERLQRRDFGGAAAQFRELLGRYPDERELHERVRLYLKVCERELGSAESAPRTTRERLYAATLAINAGTPQNALDHLRQASRDEPDNDHAHYMLAVVHGLQGCLEEAIESLRRAVDLNPENRTLARQDPDFDSIRSEEAFRTIVEAAGPPGPGRRRSRRRRR